jgi:hypothetical protein
MFSLTIVLKYPTTGNGSNIKNSQTPEIQRGLKGITFTTASKQTLEPQIGFKSLTFLLNGKGAVKVIEYFLHT